MSRGFFDALALLAARSPTVPASTSSMLAANPSENPLPPSAPVITVVTDAREVGAQQNWPSGFRTATSIPIVSNAPAATSPFVRRPTRSATPFALRSGDADAIADNHPYAEVSVLARRALVDRARREPGESTPFVNEQDLDGVRALDLERGSGDAADLVGPDDAGHQPHTRLRAVGPTFVSFTWLPPHSHLNVAEPRRRGTVAHPRDLSWLTLAAVRRSPQCPVLAAADGVAALPELRRDAGVVGVPVHLCETAVLDPPGDLASELEVHPVVVDRPRRVRRHEHAVLRVADDVPERSLARLDRDVRHPDQWEVLPAVGAHRTRAREAEHAGRLAARDEVPEDAVDDDRKPLRRYTLVVPAERAEPAGERRVRRDRHQVARVAEPVPVVGPNERRTGERLFHPQYAVELDRMADRLVDLQLHLSRVDHERRELGRALRCR